MMFDILLEIAISVLLIAISAPSEALLSTSGIIYLIGISASARYLRKCLL